MKPGRIPAKPIEHSGILRFGTMVHEHCYCEQSGPLIPKTPSPRERIYLAFGITAAEREARYGVVIAQQAHQLEIATVLTADGKPEAIEFTP